jgi:hypothetical protein
MNGLRSFWAWLRPATPPEPDHPGDDDQWSKFPKVRNQHAAGAAPELSEQDRREIAAETLDDRTRDAGGIE